VAKADRSGNREIELKLRVDDLSALMRIAIASGGTPVPTAFQKNRYLDSDERDLERLGVVLRLRRERILGHSVHVLTAKGSGVRIGHVSDVQEEEVPIDEPAARAIISGADPLNWLDGGSEERHLLVEAMKKALGKRKLIVIGVLKNERTRIDAVLTGNGTKFDATLELDRSTFPGNQTHHEVELEVPPEVDLTTAQAGFADLFKRANVRGFESAGKARRFFQALRGDRLPTGPED
jgi:uncharacterized protein YjbK